MESLIAMTWNNNILFFHKKRVRVRVIISFFAHYHSQTFFKMSNNIVIDLSCKENFSNFEIAERLTRELLLRGVEPKYPNFSSYTVRFHTFNKYPN